MCREEGVKKAASTAGSKQHRLCIVYVAMCRVEGMKRAARIAVGEKHSLALQSWCQTPCTPLAVLPQPQADWPPEDMSDAGSLLSPRADAASISSHEAVPEDSSEGTKIGWLNPDRYWQDLELPLPDGDDQAAPSRWAAAPPGLILAKLVLRHTSHRAQ